jgi:hypothetical protein
VTSGSTFCRRFEVCTIGPVPVLEKIYFSKLLFVTRTLSMEAGVSGQDADAPGGAIGVHVNKQRA